MSPAPMTFIVPFMYMKTPIATKAAVMTKGIESHDTSASVPTPHEYNFAMSEELAVYFISVVAAVNTYMTPIPMRIIVVGVVFLRNVNRMMTAVGINAKMNALMMFPNSVPGKNDIPATTANVMPNMAPEEIPVVYGSASGFLIADCITAPHTANVAPTATPAMARGMYVLTTNSLMIQSSYAMASLPLIASMTACIAVWNVIGYNETLMEKTDAMTRGMMNIK